MKFVFIFLCIGILFLSCKPQKTIISEDPVQDSTKFTYLYSEALKNKMLGQSKVAFGLFIECLNIEPTSTACAYQLSQLSSENGDITAAKMYSELCLKYKPDNEWFLLQRAEIAKKLNERDVYSGIYAQLATLFPDNLNYRYENAIILFENKKYDESLNSLEKIEEEVGINEGISFLKNNIFFAQNRVDAIQLELLHLRKAFPDSTKYSDMLAEFYLNYNQPEKALNIYQSIIDNDKNNCFANIGIAWIYGNLNKFSTGYPYLIQCFNCNDIDYSRKRKVCLLYLDKKSGLSNEFSTYIYSALLKIKSDDADILNKYISFLIDKKSYPEAERFCKISIDQIPDNFTAWDYFFNILVLQSKYKELNTYSVKALEYFPNHAVVFFFVGYSNFLLRQYNDAISYFENGIDYVSDNVDLEKQFYMFLAECYHSTNKDKQSDQYFEKYLKLDSTNAYILNNYAFYLTLRNVNLDRALDLSRRAIEIEPFNSSFLDTYSFVLYGLNEFEKAKNYIERSYKYGGNSNSVVVEHYGDILFKLNKVDDALERWKEAYSLNRNNAKLLEKINKTELGN